MPRILLIDDEAVLVKNIRKALEKAGYSVTVASTAAEALRRFGELTPDLTVLDLRLPDGSGLELLPKLLAREPAMPVLMITAYATIEDAVKAIKLGAKDYLQKPLSMDDLRHAVARALDERRLEREVSYYRGRESQGARIDALLGACEAMVELRAKLRRLASIPDTSAPPTVLIQGETGTGKGLVARILHYNGPRSRWPFIQVNCAAIPEGLVEAELFGYQRGAFTDAKTSKPGLFQSAERGTLFLDEISCLPLGVQAKILKAIEEKTVRQLGSGAEHPVNVQIITATNRDLEDLARQGSFREDLLYRVRVAPLQIPPLRERGGDALLLAGRFLGDLAARYRMPEMTLSKDAKEEISSYRWPGNVREMGNTLDRAVLFAEGKEIDAAALGLPAAAGGALTFRRRGAAELEIEIPDEGVRFENVERAMILAGLRKARGSQSEAARLLGLSRDTLRYRMEKFGIARES